ITHALTPAEGYIKRMLAAGTTVDAKGIAALSALGDAVRATITALHTKAPRVQSCDALGAQLSALRDSLPDVQVPPLHDEDAHGAAPFGVPDLSDFVDTTALEQGLAGRDDTPGAHASEPDVSSGIDAAQLELARLAAERLEREAEAAAHLEGERLAAERAEAERAAGERAEAERAEAERVEAERVDAERLAAERAEGERQAAERAEAGREAAERAEAERLEAERVAAEAAAAERAEAERLEAERVAAEARRLEAERQAAERAEAERAAETARAQARGQAERLPASPDDPDEGPDLTGLDPDLVDIFVEEGMDLLAHADGLVARLQAEPGEGDALVGLQRDLHTLKGGARMAGIMAVGELGHAMESLLE